MFVLTGDDMTKQMFNVGKIINTHGLRGEVKVHRITDFEDRFDIGAKVYAVKDNSEPIELMISSHRMHKGFDLLRFQGLDSIDDVEHLKGAMLKITKDQLTELEEGEYYYFEIIGCSVYTTGGERIGEVKEILSPGANDVWVVKRKEGKDVLIPYIEDVVKKVNPDAKEIVIHPMEGLLD